MKLNQVILEYNRSKTLSRFETKIADRLLSDHSVTDYPRPESILVLIENADPSPNGQYSLWILQNWLRGNIRYLLEDSARVRAALTILFTKKAKIVNAGHNVDINKYTFSELETLTDQFSDTKTGKEVRREDAERAQKESEIMYDGPEGKLVVPKSEFASCFWGRGTKWCTAATSSKNYFEQYAHDGKIYIWIAQDGTKYQFWVCEESGAFQYAYSNDELIDENTFSELIEIRPLYILLIEKLEQIIIMEGLYEILEYSGQIYGGWDENFAKKLALKPRLTDITPSIIVDYIGHFSDRNTINSPEAQRLIELVYKHDSPNFLGEKPNVAKLEKFLAGFSSKT